MSNPFANGNYPPGVTNRDIDEHFGSPPECGACDGTGELDELDADGDVKKCPVCCGTGIAPDKDDREEE